MKKIVVLVCMLAMVFTKGVLASGFHISAIGGVSTGGQQLSHWWNTSLQPTMEGEATPGAEITVTIDDVTRVINAGSDGIWAFRPDTALVAGDHNVTVSSNGSTVSFTLTLGSEAVDWDSVGSGATETLPTVGFFLPTLALIGTGGGLVALAKKLKEN